MAIIWKKREENTPLIRSRYLSLLARDTSYAFIYVCAFHHQPWKKHLTLNKPPNKVVHSTSLVLLTAQDVRTYARTFPTKLIKRRRESIFLFLYVENLQAPEFPWDVRTYIHTFSYRYISCMHTRQLRYIYDLACRTATKTLLGVYLSFHFLVFLLTTKYDQF